MPRYMASTITGAGSTTLPIASLYGTTGVRAKLAELHIFNQAATSVLLKLVRLTTTGTQGTALTEMPLTQEDQASIAQAFATHSVGPTITAGDLWRGSLGAAVGSGIIITFPVPLIIPNTANNGLGVVPSAGTGQICDVTFIWDE